MPVDIASGTVSLVYQDLSIPGKVPLIWDRLYSTARRGAVSALGRGWTCRYFATLTRHRASFDFITPEGSLETFADPSETVASGGVVRILGAFMELRRAGNLLVIQKWDPETAEVERFVFPIGAIGQPQRLRSIENATGHAVDLTWSVDSGRLTAITQRLERRAFIVDYSAAGLIERVRLEAPEPGGREIARYEYTVTGDQIAAFDPAGVPDRYDYDGDGRLVRETARDGGVFTYLYDVQSRCVLTTGLDRYQYKRLRYMAAARYTEVTDSYDCTIVYQYLPSGQVLSETNPLGGVKRNDYDEHGRILTRTDATGAATSYAYDDNGDLVTLTDALGGQFTFTYNQDHLPVSASDPLGHTWVREYDGHNRVIAAVDPVGSRWVTSYDDAGNAIEMSNPIGGRSRREYQRGILTATTDWEGNVTRYRIDAFGRVVESWGPRGEVSRYQYDALGNLVEAALPEGVTERAAYDAVGNLITYVNGNGHVTRFRYGTCERLVERVDALNGVMRYEWGTEPGRLVRVINEAGETTEFDRDILGRVIRTRSFDGAERSFALDAEGYSRSSTNANGQTIYFERDAVHRITAVAVPDAEPLTYGYDPAGRLATASSGGVVVRFERDPVGRIVRELQGEEWVASTYDPAGNLIRTTTSLGHVAEQQVDANGFPIRLHLPRFGSIAWERNPYGQETRRQFVGGWTLSQGYDSLGRVVEQRVTQGGTDPALRSGGGRQIIRRTYSYDRCSSPIVVADDHWGRVEYAYDPTERLVRTLREIGPTESFEYDRGGNPTRIVAHDSSGTGVDQEFVHGPGGRLLRRGPTSYEYDAEGRRTSRIDVLADGTTRRWTYQWDALDRLTGVLTPNGTRWQYTYDALFRRVEKRGPDAHHQFIWDKDALLHERDERDVRRTWISDLDTLAPVATVQNDQFYMVVTDHLGTPRELVDGAGAVVWAAGLTSWGDVFREERDPRVALDCPIRFQGQYYDSETDLCYNRFRYYSPADGEYLSADPIGLAGSNPTLYAYVRNVNLWIDPFGLVCWSTARKNFWKAEAKNNPNKYSKANLDRMKDGKAPKMRVEVVDNKTGEVKVKDVSLELHHTTIPQRVGGADVHDPSNLSIVTPWQHEDVDPYRHTGSTPLSTVQGVDSWPG